MARVRYSNRKLPLLGSVHAVLQSIDERLPGGFDDVLGDPDGAPHPLAVGRVYEDAGGGRRGAVFVEDADLVVGEVDLFKLRIVGYYGFPQRLIQGVYRTVALRGGDDPLASYGELYGRLCRRLPAGALLGDDPERLQLEERPVLPRGTPDQQRERGVGRLVMIALVLALLYGPEDQGRILGLEPEFPCLGPDGVLPREFPYGRPPYVPYGLGRDVLVGRRVLRDAVDVQPAFVRKRATPHVGTMRVRRQVHELRDVVGDLGEPPQPLVIHDLEAHLELQVGDGRNEVAVAAALPDTVYRSLYVRRPRLYRHQGIRHPTPRVVVGVDAYLCVRELAHRARHDRLELGRQGPAVRVTKDQSCRPRFGGGAAPRQRVRRLVTAAVAAVLGVEDDLVAGARQVGDGVAHGLEVLLGRGPQDLLDVQLPALGDDAGDGSGEGG